MDGLPPIIRPERCGDEVAIDAVESAAFPTPAEARIVRALRDACVAPIISLVAEMPQSNTLVGHILFTPVTVESQPSWTALGLGPMAVLPRMQRRGIGSQLVRAGLQACRALGQPVVFVVGHPAFYPRFDFVPAARFGIRWDHPVPEDVFMVSELAPDALANRRGVVHYRPEFHAAQK